MQPTLLAQPQPRRDFLGHAVPPLFLLTTAARSAADASVGRLLPYGCRELSAHGWRVPLALLHLMPSRMPAVARCACGLRVSARTNSGPLCPPGCVPAGLNARYAHLCRLPGSCVPIFTNLGPLCPAGACPRGKAPVVPARTVPAGPIALPTLRRPAHLPAQHRRATDAAGAAVHLGATFERCRVPPRFLVTTAPRG